jgi:zinc D-Ala-D-Ala carboxypeptidase
VRTAPGFHAKAPIWTDDEKKRWPSFSPGEFDCKGSGEYWHDPRALDMLQAMRSAIGKPLVINSGHRSAAHNARVGGVPNSQHRRWAVDISTDGHDRRELVRAAIAAGFTGIGFGATFLHLDPRSKPVAWPYSGSMASWAKAFGFDPLRRFRLAGLSGLLY